MFLIAIVLSFSSLFTMLAMALIKPIYGVLGADDLLLQAATNAEALMQDSQKVNALKFIQLFTTIGTFLFPAFIFSFISDPLGDFLKLRSNASLKFYLIAIATIIISAPMIGMFYEWNQLIQLPDELLRQVTRAEEQAASLTRLFLHMPKQSDLVFNLILIGLFPAVAEELLFRGVLQRLIHERVRNIHAAVWLTAAIFSLVHFQFLGFVPRMLLGGILGYTFYASGSIWVPVVAHAFNNTAQVVMAYLFQRGMISYDIENNEHTPLYLGLLSLMCCVVIIVLMLRHKKPPQSNTLPSDSNPER
jgi:hypothetical protein